MYVPFNEPGIGQIVARTFPENRKPISVQEFSGAMRCNSYWQGGSRDYFKLINLESLEVWEVPTSHPYFDRNAQGESVGNLELRELPPNTALVVGGYFCGKPRTITVYLRSENMVKLLPPPNDLSELERKALNAIAGLKGGHYRADEFARQGLGKYGADNPLVISLIGKGMLTANKSGAIAVTIEGRNARNNPPSNPPNLGQGMFPDID